MFADGPQITALSAAASDAELHMALTLVLCRLPEPTAEALRWSAVADIRRGAATAETLWTARSGRGAVGAVWGQLAGGSVAQIWPPQWLAGTRPDGPDPLLAALLADLPRHGATFAQTLLPTADDPDAKVLLTAGFLHAADLAYLTADVVEPDSASAPGAPELVPYSAARRQEFADLVDRTYEGTLDCPALDGLRPIDEVLDEYAQVGVGGTAHWYFVREQHENVGCLLLADHPSQNQVELVYMALLPRARGRALGHALVRHVLRIAASLRRERVVLAVDAANEPAAAHYRNAGFREWERRAAFIKKLPSP